MIEEKIAASVVESYRRDRDKCHSVISAYEIGFNSGYMEALRELFPLAEEFSEDDLYWVVTKSGEWVECNHINGQFFTWEVGGIGPNGEEEIRERVYRADEIAEIRFTDLPEPSGLFRKIIERQRAANPQ